ncbi:DUF3999 family protein [Aquimarina algicola]|uniref:DUF3999 family protein n=1 Tax=Aquimarina algicola TaxID=2589995 RepID=A0A504JG46_9FLAO|nr:DUF3999 family protein [Aquimarina algicola]TPN85361.1 DUF3999 family protein [Aquimarina algicola]
MKKIVNLLFILVYISTYAQLDQYQYKSKLTGIQDTWHSITLPNQVFGKVQSNLSDIRVFGITEKNDTIEAPYILKVNSEKISRNTVSFSILNTVHNAKGTYVTLKVPNKDVVNQIELAFKEPNFDWLVTLEGSENKNDWFTITEDYRILSIQNEYTNYEFTTLKFPEAQYSYFRIWIKNTQKAKLHRAEILQYVVKTADYLDYKISNTNIHNDKENKKTVIDLSLQESLSASTIKVNVKSDFDYYRPTTISYVSDSTKNKEGNWIYKYRTLTSGTLNSIEDNTFTFSNTIVKKLKIVISNYDNQPLEIKDVEVKGYTHQLMTRFTEPATYYLAYGNQKARRPSYDLNYVSSKIPETMTAISTGDEELIYEQEDHQVEPLFANKMWLWAVMLVIILLLGGFTLSMMKKKG